MIKRTQKTDYISVNEYLDTLNRGLANYNGRVVGEVTETQLYPERSYLFFKIKDKDEDNPATLSCFMWKRDYKISGLELGTGLEVVVSGVPSVYKPLGRLSFHVQSVELVGEGALKKQYEKLKAQLEKEGLLAVSKKRPLPLLPQRIGLITSKDGAAIGDFQVNLGKFGFKVSLIDSRVEGQLAVQELLASIRTFRKKDIEVLVLVRGGGSLESLLSFNNETLVREIASFPVPVLVGVGHEKDISLAALAADKMVSTPTATAEVLNDSWQRSVSTIDSDGHKILFSFERILSNKQAEVNDSFQTMKGNLQIIFDRFTQAVQALRNAFVSVRARISELTRHLEKCPQDLLRHMESAIIQANQHVSTTWKLLETHNPERHLRLGYSIIHSQGKLIRKIGQVHIGESVDVRIQDGSFVSEVRVINKNK